MAGVDFSSALEAIGSKGTSMTEAAERAIGVQESAFAATPESLLAEFGSAQGMFMGAQMAQAIIGAVGQIWRGFLQSDMVKSSLAHAETMDALEYGKHDKDGKLVQEGMAQYAMNAKSKLNHEIKEIATEGIKVTEERAAAERGKAEQTALYVEAKKTEKAGEIDQAPLDDLFADPRRRYERGSPKPEVHA